MAVCIHRNAGHPQVRCRKISHSAWRIRIGFYRVIYEIQDDKLIIMVVHIGHRKEVYK